MYNGRKKILFICGSMNQTTQMHQLARELPEYEHYYTPYYCDGLLERARKANLLEPTILGNKMVNRCWSYLQANKLTVDYQGLHNNYDLVLTCSDLVIPKNIRDKKVLLVQEGMTDRETFVYYFVRKFKFLPLWLSSTAATGLSDHYDLFCVASEGYRDLFIRKGARPEKIVVTGIPNFDNCKKYLINSFPHKNFVLVCTSDSRETFVYENRKKFIQKAVEIARGRRLMFKLHPNENLERATREINRYAPGALVYPTGNTEEMIANCDVLITRFSSTVYVGIALGKEAYSEFDLQELRRLAPIQNASAAKNIANVCRELLEGQKRRIIPPAKRRKRSLRWTRRTAYIQSVMNLGLNAFV